MYKINPFIVILLFFLNYMFFYNHNCFYLNFKKKKKKINFIKYK